MSLTFRTTFLPPHPHPPSYFTLSLILLLVATVATSQLTPQMQVQCFFIPSASAQGIFSVIICVKLNSLNSQIEPY
ncbi:hypothetical protein LZ30DRAFT_742089 [Colletotrichum cereale]|nr:hypothetical protein LZ30DRAFT_742089 [Colletotrichum cereale]